MPIKVRCKCGKKLQVRDSAAGKRVRCPDCGKPVRIPEPETVVDDYDDTGDDFGDPYGDDGYNAAPKRRKPSGKSKKKKSSGGIPTPVLLVGGIFIGSLLVGGALYLILSGGGNNGNDVVDNSGETDQSPTGTTGSSDSSTSGNTAPNSGQAGDQNTTQSPDSNGSMQQPATTPTSAPPASGSGNQLWVILSDFKKVSDPNTIGNSYQINYRIAAGSPDPAKKYVIYVGASMGSVMERYNEVPLDLQNNGTVHIPAGIGVSGNVRAYVGWKKGRQDWEPVSGEIKLGGGPTEPNRPPTVLEAAGAAAKGKTIVIANARFTKSRLGGNALVLDYTLQAAIPPGKRIVVVLEGSGEPMRVQLMSAFRRTQPGESGELPISLIGGKFPAGSLKIHLEATVGLRDRNPEVISNTVTLQR